MEENSKNDALSQKAMFSQLSRKTPIECHLCNKKLKSKFGYTLHLKKYSKNVHVSEENKDYFPEDNCSTFTNIFVNHGFTNFNYTYRYNDSNIPNILNNSTSSLNNFFHIDNNNQSWHTCSL